MQKLISFAVPCYNSAAYMRHCIETLLSAGEQAEIILVDDGSTKDDTPAICDEYAAKYPTIVKAVHQENGGHGEGVNQGIRNATGLYYKVVDSDDWLDTDALKKVLHRLQTLVARGTAPDLMICNYVYEHVEDGTSHTVRYTNVFPKDRLFDWVHVGHFRPDQNLLMHSVMYRTEVLRQCGMVLPKHTFYVDNIFVYQMCIRDRVSRVWPYSGTRAALAVFIYVTLTLFGWPSHAIRLTAKVLKAIHTPEGFLLSVCPLPRSLATTNGISFDVSSSPYLDVSVPVSYTHLLYLSSNSSL